MSNKSQYKAKALDYFIQGMALKDIAKILPLSVRTLSVWSKKNEWEKEKQERNKEITVIAEQSVIICKKLGQNIKLLLENGKEPSATLLNAYSKLSGAILNLKKQESNDEKENQNEKIKISNSNKYKDLAKKTFEEIFKHKL